MIILYQSFEIPFTDWELTFNFGSRVRIFKLKELDVIQLSIISLTVISTWSLESPCGLVYMADGSECSILFID